MESKSIPRQRSGLRFLHKPFPSIAEQDRAEYRFKVADFINVLTSYANQRRKLRNSSRLTRLDKPIDQELAAIEKLICNLVDSENFQPFSKSDMLSLREEVNLENILTKYSDCWKKILALQSQCESSGAVPAK